MSKVTIEQGFVLHCPDCGKWLAQAKVPIIGGESVIGDDNFSFAEGLWGENNVGMNCPKCEMPVNHWFTDADNWREPDDGEEKSEESSESEAGETAEAETTSQADDA
jgi:hypothetical protein